MARLRGQVIRGEQHAEVVPSTWSLHDPRKILVLPSPFFPGILLSRKPPETHGNGRFSTRTMVGKNGESTLRKMGSFPKIKRGYGSSF